MRKAVLEKLPRLLLCLLMAVGLIYTVLGVLDTGESPWQAFLVCAVICAFLEGITLTRKAAALGSALLILVCLGWAISGTGWRTLTDLLRAFTLKAAGIPGALPLVAGDASMAVAVIAAVLCFLCTRKGAGAPAAILMTGGLLLMLWLMDRPEMMIRLLPTGIAALTLLMMDRHPEAALKRVFPWAAVILLAAFLLTPGEGVVVPELKEMADSFRQTVMDRMFYTEPRDVFSLASEGYYPQGSSQLGGSVTPSDHQVMQVSTPRTVYLRGVMMNQYDGRCWRNTLGGRRYLWDASGMQNQRILLFDQNLPADGLASALTKEADVSVRMLRDSASTLFVPGRVRQIRTGGELVPYYTNSAEIFATRNLQAGDTWTVSAPLVMAGDPGLGTLVDAASGHADPQWETVRETYTALPTHLEEPVWQMATDVTENLTKPYEKAFALQNYLRRNYRYTLQVENQPGNIDFVTNFLFNTREGYCTYFASAMTVLCRMAGIPARYVEGYLARPNGQGEALVTGRDAHAWTEVYFQGFGWIPFDATPGEGRGGSGAEEEKAKEGEPPLLTPTPTVTLAPEMITPAPAEAPMETAAPAKETAEEYTARRGGFPWWAVFAVILLLCLAAVLRVWMTDPGRREKKMTTEQERFDLWMGETVRMLSIRGMERKAGETIMSFTRRLDREGKSSTSLSQFGECASLLHYGRVQALSTDTDLARKSAEGLWKEMSLKEKTECIWRRCCQKKADMVY